MPPISLENRGGLTPDGHDIVVLGQVPEPAALGMLVPVDRGFGAQPLEHLVVFEPLVPLELEQIDAWDGHDENLVSWVDLVR